VPYCAIEAATATNFQHELAQAQIERLEDSTAPDDHIVALARARWMRPISQSRLARDDMLDPLRHTPCLHIGAGVQIYDERLVHRCGGARPEWRREKWLWNSYPSLS
jgi:hypothetical protein